MNKTKTRKRKFNYFIGIDVSRNKLDLAIRDEVHLLFHKEIANEPAAILNVVGEFKKLKNFRMFKAVFCLEDCGYYMNHLVDVLRKHRTNIHIGNPMHIKNSLGLLRDKSDRLDAIRIAHYGYRCRDELRIWEPRRKEIEKLSALLTVRNRMMTTMGMVREPLKNQRGYIDHSIHKQVVSCCEGSLVSITADINLLEKSMLKLIRADASLSRIYDIICSVPYVGPVTAIQIIISTNEFLDISCPRKFSCYAGIAPFKQESGQMSGKGRGRISKVANRKVKTLLHICAVGGIRRKGEFRDYYDRRVAEGKPPMTIVNAIRNKLVRRIFACVKHDRLYLNPAELHQLQNKSSGLDTISELSGKRPQNRQKFAARTLKKPI